MKGTKKTGPTAQGSSMGSPKKIGEAPSKSNAQQPVRTPGGHGVKGLGSKRVTTGY